MTMSDLDWLQQWFVAHCDGDWEHQYGLRLLTLDNPGWSLTVDLHDTELAAVTFTPVRVNRSQLDWIACEVSEHRFEGRGGAGNVSELVRVFRSFAERPSENVNDGSRS
jgi:hypothetical protein